MGTFIYIKIIMEEEILLVDKPRGISSFDVIRMLRKKLNIRKIGHAGTLDPLASGLMIVGVEKGTKKLSEYLKLDKVYEAEILLGVSTDTGDMEGKVLKEKRAEFSKDQIEKVIKGMIGEIKLHVPMYSAIKVDGKRLYKYAREGKKVDLPVKNMHIYSFKLNKIKKTELGLILFTTIKVSSGTYIRSIAEEVGRRLTVPSTLFNLRRTEIGDFHVNDSIDIT